MRLRYRIAILTFLLVGTASMVGNSILKNNVAEGADSFTSGKPVKAESDVKASALPASQGKVPVVTVILRKENMVLFRSAFTALTVSAAQKELLEKSAKLGRGEALYIVLDTPGGSIPAGEELIELANNLGRPVHTITQFAASMGFNTAQQLGQRYITAAGTLMAHRARVEGIGGQVPGEFLTAVANITTMVQRFEKKNAARLHISMEEYTRLVKDEYWVQGEEAVREGAADALVNIQCDSSLGGTHTTVEQTFFGEVSLVWADCPAITQPLSYSFAGTPEQAQKVRSLLSDYREFRRAAVNR